MKDNNLNEYGMAPLTTKHYLVYGLGNFASQLSWTMVSTYLSIFYTDVYGLGYVAGPCGAGMMVDAIDDFDDKYGYRNDGMAFSFQGCAIKVATAIANALFLVVMGAFGYAGGVEMTPHIQQGINIAANLLRVDFLKAVFLSNGFEYSNVLMKRSNLFSRPLILFPVFLW